jgi:formylglycine-generating enzyme required for sulfatase activity
VGLREDGLPDLVWCEVPAGPFLMGSPDEDELAYDDEKPKHTYEIKQPYFISRYPITNAQYDAFVQGGGYREARYWTEAGWAWRKHEEVIGPRDYGMPYILSNYPVIGVSWYEAVAFCRWLKEYLRTIGHEFKVWEDGEIRERNAPFETFNIQLPSEPQWEKAARGKDGRIYPWGSEPDSELANYDETGIGTTSAVGCFPGGTSPYGVVDLTGNVYEWCRTKWRGGYQVYENDGAVSGSARRVLRGGAFYDHVRLVRCAVRYSRSPDLRIGYVGFRVCLSS